MVPDSWNREQRNFDLGIQRTMTPKLNLPMTISNPFHCSITTCGQVTEIILDVTLTGFEYYTRPPYTNSLQLY